MSDSIPHALEHWMAGQRPAMSQKDAAVKLGVSAGYLALVLARTRGVSLKRAKEWAGITGLAIEAFLQPEGQAA